CACSRRCRRCAWPRLSRYPGLTSISLPAKFASIKRVIDRGWWRSRQRWALLRAQLGHHETAVFTFVARRAWGNPENGPCYVKGQRYPISYWGTTSARRRDWRKAGVALTFHDLRRTAAARMRAAVSMEAAQELLGHDDTETTKLYLGEADVDRQREAMRRRDAWEAQMRERAANEGENSRTNSRSAGGGPSKLLKGR